MELQAREDSSEIIRQLREAGIVVRPESRAGGVSYEYFVNEKFALLNKPPVRLQKLKKAKTAQDPKGDCQLREEIECRMEMAEKRRNVSQSEGLNNWTQFHGSAYRRIMRLRSRFYAYVQDKMKEIVLNLATLFCMFDHGLTKQDAIETVRQQQTKHIELDIHRAQETSAQLEEEKALAVAQRLQQKDIMSQVSETNIAVSRN